jgi:hypothetical protein
MSTLPSVLDVLRAVIHLLDAACERGGWHRPALLVHLGALPQGLNDAIDIGLKPLPDGVHPLVALDGLVAPPQWQVLGVVAEGRAFAFGPPGPPGDEGPPVPTGRVRVIELLARDGTRLSAVRPQDGELVVIEADGTEPVAGEITLALCRALGVPVVGGRLAVAPTRAGMRGGES